MQITDLSFPKAEFEYLRGLNPKIRDLVGTKDNIMDIRELQQACFQLDTQYVKCPWETEEALDVSRTRQRPIRFDPKQSRMSQRWKNIICYYCGQKGHYKISCQNPLKVSDTKQNLTPKANIASSATIIDSRVTQHMFNDLDIFGDLMLKEYQIQCANSQWMRSTHIGTAKIGVLDTLADSLYVPGL